MLSELEKIECEKLELLASRSVIVSSSSCLPLVYLTCILQPFVV